MEFRRARDDCVRCTVVRTGLFAPFVAMAKVVRTGEEARDGEFMTDAFVLPLKGFGY